MINRFRIFDQDAARLSHGVTFFSLAICTAALIACSDRTTGPSSTSMTSHGAAAIHDASVPTAPLVTGLQRARGSAVGPDGALYVTESSVGRISRVDPADGTVTTFASGFPLSPLAAGGVVDVAFGDGTAYALVTIVGTNFVGGPVPPDDHTAVGIYRVD